MHKSKGTKWYHDIRVTFLPDSKKCISQVEVLIPNFKLYMNKLNICIFMDIIIGHVVDLTIKMFITAHIHKWFLDVYHWFE